MPDGVPSDVFYLWPYPVSVQRGNGASIWDQDNNSYVDFSMGFGVSVWGHAHPALARAIADRAQRGSHFGALGEEVVSWSEELVRRFQGRWVRFSNSGSEATQDALRLSRAWTGRSRIAKINGAYHGSHDIALLNANFPEGSGYRPAGEGLSPGIMGEIDVLEWNDPEEAEAVLREEGCAALILEPILFNVGAIWPEDGYLEELRRICNNTGTLLVFDETKTGHTVAWGGAEELFGVRPDLKTVGKGIGGGIPCGAIIGNSSWGEDVIERTPHLGTFSGTHITAAAGAAALRLLGPDQFKRLEDLRMRLHTGIEEVIQEFSLPAYSIGAGAKNCLVWADPQEGPLRNFDDYCRRFDAERAETLWFWMFNRGVWLAQGRDEQTTHSLAHTENDIDYFLEVFRDGAPKI